ncbi:hypothetical protein J2Z21_000739 [Streptomyces griseochromogenes]|uniref:Uncharacterized protein n=1 Tax=Streptomyces griseochromogenes TaxID=68214 RepID=A0ABS4LKA7_9ACTN|nr:hypothetical protein [Streptomyces griseochromogenes]MBP2047817.1 hypothetical protein [Streptomyces griseochromogenes]
MPVRRCGLRGRDAPVLEAQVRAGGLESLVEGAVVDGELADALFEGGVLGGDPLDGALGPLSSHIAYLAEEFAAPSALGEDLGVGGFEGVLGVQGAFAPGPFAFVVLLYAADRDDEK